MDKKNKNKVSILGEFVDKSMESEFQEYSMNSNSKAIAYVILAFGFMFMLFLCNDYYVIESISSFPYMTFIRMFIFFISVIVFLLIKKTMKYIKFIYLITAYEVIVMIAFLMVLQQYNSLRYLTFFSLMILTLAIYFIPNRIKLSQIISIILSILFFLYPTQKIEGLEENDIYKIIAYQIILLIYCNISTCMTNTYKRKQFVSSRDLLALSILDPLTGTYNRAKFDEEIDRWTNLSNNYGNPLSIILLDIDNFKMVNDSYGHLIGDSVIKKIVETINKSIRKTDIFARWGGEEFVILLPNTNIWEAKEMAERMRLLIRNNRYDPAKNITCSFGIATHEREETAQSLLRKVDDLLLQAKGSGKDRVVCQIVD